MSLLTVEHGMFGLETQRWNFKIQNCRGETEKPEQSKEWETCVGINQKNIGVPFQEQAFAFCKFSFVGNI